MRVVFCGTGWFPIVEAIEEAAGIAVEIRAPGVTVAEAIEDADVVLPSNGRIDRAALEGARRLRLVQQPAAGYDAIDLEAAEALGVPVCNAPGANGDALAEVAVLLLLSVARKTPRARRSVREVRIGEPVGVELHGKTLTLIGAGRSGSRVASVAKAFGMTVRTVRSTNTREELLEALAGAHAVSVHCPLTDRTRNLVDAEAIARLRPGALLVNAARGPIVDRDAMVAALDDGQLGGVGLDVLWKEPWDPADPLLSRDDVVVLPHVGGSTQEAFDRVASIVADNLGRLERQEPLAHRII